MMRYENAFFCPFSEAPQIIHYQTNTKYKYLVL